FVCEFPMATSYM
ncbi:yjgP/YjgQ family domain protein, partial [Chlamydia psittaci 84-8471/1]